MGEINESVITLSDEDLGRVYEPTDVLKVRMDNQHSKTQGWKLHFSIPDKDTKLSSLSTAIDEASIDSNTKQDNSTDANALKKPNEILPCPRCKSLNTKFCYFNNQNVNQPRHFCKNCQRYWTSGGSMRNVPVGSGKRKSKLPISHPSFEQVTKKPFNPITVAPGPACENTDAGPRGPQTCGPPQGYVTPPWAYSWAPPMMVAAPPPMSGLPFQLYQMFPVFPDMMTSLGGKKEEEEKRTIWAPKTLRVDNPEEAAKSSIWSTLGIKRDESVKRDWLFRGFASTNETSDFGASDAAKLAHLNPAASARSRLFQESA